MVVAAVLLAACGGGSGRAGPAAARPQPPPADSAADLALPGPLPDAATPGEDSAAGADTALEAAEDAGVAGDAAPPDAAMPAPDLAAEGPSPAGEAVAVETTCAVPPVAMPPLVRLAFDVRYASPAGQDQLLDVAWPAGGGVHPVVVLIHGGGWVTGDKMQHRQAIHRLAGLGYVGVSINHRLATTAENKFPAAVKDVRCALRWLRARAASYEIDPEQAAIMGTSAGAHLAALVATASTSNAFDSAECLPDEPLRLRAVIAYYGVYDLRLLSSFSGQVANFLGSSDPAVASLASPVVHIDAADPPFLLVHGTADNMAPPLFSQSMKDALRAGGVAATYVELPGAPHGFDVFDAMWPASTCTALAFLHARLGP